MKRVTKPANSVLILAYVVLTATFFIWFPFWLIMSLLEVILWGWNKVTWKNRKWE